MALPRSALVLAVAGALWFGEAPAGGNPPEFVLQWGASGAAEGEFSGPHGIEVDAAGNVYVADTGNHRIQKFTSDGVFMLAWGTFGTDAGDFDHPHGIGIGPTGNVYVAETGNNRVQKRPTPEGSAAPTSSPLTDRARPASPLGRRDRGAS